MVAAREGDGARRASGRERRACERTAGERLGGGWGGMVERKESGERECVRKNNQRLRGSTCVNAALAGEAFSGSDEVGGGGGKMQRWDGSGRGGVDKTGVWRTRQGGRGEICAEQPAIKARGARRGLRGLVWVRSEARSARARLGPLGGDLGASRAVSSVSRRHFGASQAASSASRRGLFAASFSPGASCPVPRRL